MYHCPTALIAGIIATVLVSGIAMSIPAEAAKLSKAERVALEKATAVCKDGGEGHEVHLALVEAPEIRQKVHHKDGCPNQSRHRHLANPQGGGYEKSPGAATRGMGM